MGIGAGLYMYDVVVKKFTFAISSADEFLFTLANKGLFLLLHCALRSRSLDFLSAPLRFPLCSRSVHVLTESPGLPSAICSSLRGSGIQLQWKPDPRVRTV